MKTIFSKLKAFRGPAIISVSAFIAVSFLGGMVFASILINGEPVKNTNTYKPAPEKDKKGVVYSVSSSVYGNGWKKVVFKCNEVYYYMDFNENQINSVQVDENARIGCKEGNMAKYGFKVTTNPNH